MSDVHKLESERWDRGDEESDYYHEALETSENNPIAQHGDGPDKKSIKPEEMPRELAPQGYLKHVVNADLADDLGAPVRGTDIYIQEIPPGSESGKHRHMSEELIFVLEGEGYDRHWDPTLEIKQDVVEWEFPEESMRFDWIPEDVIYVPTNTAHQHVNASDEEPARLLCCQARVYNTLGYGFEDLEQFETAPEYDG